MPRRSVIGILSCVFCLLALTAFANAEQPGVAASQPSDVTRKYDAANLFPPMEQLDLKVPASFPEVTSKAAPSTQATHLVDPAEQAKQVEEYIRFNCPSMADSIGVFQTDGTTLIVHAPQDVQAHVAQMLADLSVHIQLTARIFVCPASTIDKLNLPQASPAAALHLVNSQDPVLLTREQLGILMKAIGGEPKDTSLGVPGITVANHQRAFATVETEQAYISDLTLIHGRDGDLFDPVISTIPAVGFTCAVHADFDTAGGQTIVGMKCGLTQLRSLKPLIRQAQNNGRVINGTLQVPTQSATDVRVIVAIPKDQSVLVGGAVTDVMDTTDDPPRMYVVITPELSSGK